MKVVLYSHNLISILSNVSQIRRYSKTLTFYYDDDSQTIECCDEKESREIMTEAQDHLEKDIPGYFKVYY